MSQQMDIAELRKRIRHSAAHVMADVVTTMYPHAKLGIGPPTDDGFYYDFMSTSRSPSKTCPASKSKCER